MKRRGFTLIELTVVLAVVAVLSAALVARLSVPTLKATALKLAGRIREWRASAPAGTKLLVGKPATVLLGGRKVALPEGIRIGQLKVASQEVDRLELELRSSRAMAPIELTLTDGARSLTLRLHPLLNQVELE